jgi:hypothetical protein
MHGGQLSNLLLALPLIRRFFVHIQIRQLALALFFTVICCPSTFVSIIETDVLSLAAVYIFVLDGVV